MSDGGWYGYPSQEPDPYSQPQDDGYRSTPDYGDAPQASGYDQYGRPLQPNQQHQSHQNPQGSQSPQGQQYYQQQQPQGQRGPQQGAPQGQPGQPGQHQGQSPRPRPQQGQGQPRPGQQPQGGPGQGGPGQGGQGQQYRQQQRPPQRPAPQSQQQAQNPYFQQQEFGYDTGTGGYGGASGSHQQYSTGQQPTADYEGYGRQSGYNTGGYPRQDYERSGYDTSTGYPGQGYEAAAGYDAAAYGSGSYDTGSRSGGYNSASPGRGQSRGAADGYGVGSGDAYAAQPQGSADGYGGARGTRAASPSSYSAERDPYADLAGIGELSENVDEYPGRGGRRRAAPVTGEQPRVSEDGRFGLLDGRDEDSATESPSVPGIDEDDDEDGGRRRGGGRSGGTQKGKKAGRSCTVIFLFFALVAGGLGYGGYQGYKWYQSHYGPPADYSSTTGIASTAIVTIPSGAGGTRIASILYSAGVVESQRAFINACDSNSKCANIQANTYQLHKQMSAAAAVTALLNTSNVYNKSQLLVRPGERASSVFTDLEQKTGWTQAQIVAAINSGKVDLPSYATAKTGTKYPFANVEGLLFTGTYQLPSYSSPTALIKAMIDQQLAMFNAVGLTQKASSLGITPYQVLIVASMARAEAGSDAVDLGKISGVIYTRLKNYSYSKLGFDTATLYGLGRTEPQPTAAELADTSNPYNLRVVRGLPPGPIDSVDQTALMGALAPSDSSDVYFCAVNGTIHYASNDTSWSALGKQYPGYCG